MRKWYTPFYWQNSKPQQSDEFSCCADLPFIRFIKVTVTGDLSHLGVCANPEQTWERIHSEYTELSNDETSTRGLELAKQITFLTNKINITNLIVAHLSFRNVPELITELQDMGYRLQFTNLEADLKRVLSLSKSDQMKLTAAQSAYDALPKGNKSTERDWYGVLSVIAKHRGLVTINPAMISVLEYCVMEKEFKDYIAAMK